MSADTNTPRGSDRPHNTPARQHRINLRLDPDEHEIITTAAARTGKTPTGFCADAALTTARATDNPDHTRTGPTHSELADVQRELFAARIAVTRTGTNLNQAVAALNTTGQAPIWLDQAVRRSARSLDTLDSVLAEIDRRLR